MHFVAVAEQQQTPAGVGFPGHGNEAHAGIMAGVPQCATWRAAGCTRCNRRVSDTSIAAEAAPTKKSVVAEDADRVAVRAIMAAMHRHFIPFVLSLLLALFTAGAGMPITAHAADTDAKQAATAKKLAEVKQRIAKLAREQREAGTRRDSIQKKLAQQSDKLAAAARAVRESDQALADNQHKLDELTGQRDALKTHLATQRDALADLLRAAYKIRPDSDLRLLLGNEDLARLARALAYSRYFQKNRMQRIQRLLGQLDRLQQVQADIQTERAALEKNRAERQSRVQSLDTERAAQRKLLAEVKTQLGDKKRQMRQLEADRKSLATLLKKLRDVIKDVPDQLPGSAPFAKLRGKLPWPVKGKSSSANEGLHITAARGTRVHAVAHGRVVYADWLRGYGLLVIVDHGQGWLSLYGDNESVLRHPGDWVNAGDTIATAGASTGDDAGVYFGLRHHGKSVNPLPWLGKR